MSKKVHFPTSTPQQATPGFLTTPLKACACAGEQRSRGEFKYQVLSPLPLCISDLKLVRNAGTASTMPPLSLLD
ncbi:hypothetical protein [Nostoc sp. ATCC 53789]|uniref:hypothetical protein n=1 Tax=Nostoc sp. ATCC 53789 TaxID=76335 RepID=UPI0011BF33DC|nr:hypothetical protein [Nostoc sp. ATCC 53789]QHG20711.1 hypothetical protein GJB62_33160 [Nostoc sp. ATCC 53789]